MSTIFLVAPRQREVQAASRRALLDMGLGWDFVARFELPLDFGKVHFVLPNPGSNLVPCGQPI